jgi:hypothetical protein
MTPSNIALSYITTTRESALAAEVYHPVMLRLSLGLLVVGLFAVGPGGCKDRPATAGDASTGGDGPAVDGRITVDGPPALDSATTGGFVTADVDGVAVRVEIDVRSGTSGLGAGRIWITAGTVSTDAWNLYIDNSVGTSTCPPDWVALFEDTGDVLRAEGGSCSVTVTAAAPALGDVIEGTFTATLKTLAPDAPRTAAVTNGAFRATRNFQ